jgi:hypothetical protein
MILERRLIAILWSKIVRRAAKKILIKIRGFIVKHNARCFGASIAMGIPTRLHQFLGLDKKVYKLGPGPVG